jgi:hypothetical protein
MASMVVHCTSEMRPQHYLTLYMVRVYRFLVRNQTKPARGPISGLETAEFDGLWFRHDALRGVDDGLRPAKASCQWYSSWSGSQFSPLPAETACSTQLELVVKNTQLEL